MLNYNVVRKVSSLYHLLEKQSHEMVKNNTKASSFADEDFASAVMFYFSVFFLNKDYSSTLIFPTQSTKTDKLIKKKKIKSGILFLFFSKNL